MTADNGHNASLTCMQRLLAVEIALRKHRHNLPPELQSLATMLRDVRFELDGQRPAVQKLETPFEASWYEMTERADALRINEARLRTIFEKAPVGIGLLDEERRIIQSNPQLESMLAHDAMPLTAVHFHDYVHCDDIDDLQAQEADLLAGNAQARKLKCRLVNPQGETVWTRITMTLVGEHHNHPPMILVIIEDITEERQAELALIQTEKLILTGRLTTSLAHEVNNPLQTAIGCLGLAGEARGQEEDIDLYLRMASEELKRTANVVTRLRDLNYRSKPEEREPTDIRAIIQQVLDITHKQCRERGIDVYANLDREVPDIQVVPDQLQQVFLNLVLNAMEAMPDGGTLKVRVVPLSASDGVKILFEDTGIGIPRGEQSHIFEAFQTTKSDGLGLGLFISQFIIEDHGGSIEVNSQPEEGSAFIIRLPV